MPRDADLIEADALAIVRRHIAGAATQLESLGLVADVEEISRAGEGMHYQSEARVYFYAGKNIADVIEFHIYRGGVQRIIADDLDRWLPEAIGDVIRRRSGSR